jgi:hypothetical protein
MKQEGGRKTKENDRALTISKYIVSVQADDITIYTETC